MQNIIRSDSFKRVFKSCQLYPSDFEVQFDKIDASNLCEVCVNEDRLDNSTTIPINQSEDSDNEINRNLHCLMKPKTCNEKASGLKRKLIVVKSEFEENTFRMIFFRLFI